MVMAVGSSAIIIFREVGAHDGYRGRCNKMRMSSFISYILCHGFPCRPAHKRSPPYRSAMQSGPDGGGLTHALSDTRNNCLHPFLPRKTCFFFQDDGDQNCSSNSATRILHRLTGKLFSRVEVPEESHGPIVAILSTVC